MIRWGRHWLVALLIASAGVVVATGQIRERDPKWTAPPEAAARPNPLAGRPEYHS